jgi:hypothetical protein
VLIYPDSSNLINLIQGRIGADIEVLGTSLKARGHYLVLSFQTLMELSWPALRKDETLEVRRDLNRLDQLPTVFVNDGAIAYQEYQEAARAFREHREWAVSGVEPICNRLCDAIDPQGRSYVLRVGGMRIPLLNVGTAETMLEMWRRDRDTFSVHRRRYAEWMRMMRRDRSIPQVPKLGDHFVVATRRNLELHGLRIPSDEIEELARWIYSSPPRCPGVRMGYETQHRLRRDRNTGLKPSDIIDIFRVHALPYVDFFVTDKRMMKYCREAAKEIGGSWNHQLLGTFDEVLDHLGVTWR